MKRSCPSHPVQCKRMRVHTLKRKGDFEVPCGKRLCVYEDLKRKCEDTHGVSKRLRVKEQNALHNMLVQAYEKIHQLETELHQAQITLEYYCSKMNQPAYNHDIIAY